MADRVIDSFQGEYRWLSNFWPAGVVYAGALYTSVEHAYVAAKTTDEDVRFQVRCTVTPGQVKRLGRSIKLRPDWEDIKLSVMEDLLRQKFFIVPLRKLLMSTVGIELVEGNTWGDKFWGVCGGEGENHLGRLIMKIRSEWMEQEA